MSHATAMKKKRRGDPPWWPRPTIDDAIRRIIDEHKVDQWMERARLGIDRDSVGTLDHVLAETGAQRDWLSFTFTLPRRLHWFAFKTLKPHLDGPEYWRLLREVYQEGEATSLGKGLPRLFRSRRPGRESMMTEAERARLTSLPDTIRVFRGCQEQNRDGWSWTLSEERGRWFAARNARGEGFLLVAEVQRQHVLALLDGREEEELLCDPEHVQVLREERVSKVATAPPATAASK